MGRTIIGIKDDLKLIIFDILLENIQEISKIHEYINLVKKFKF
jgi:hypothetical protein